MKKVVHVFVNLIDSCFIQKLVLKCSFKIPDPVLCLNLLNHRVASKVEYENIELVFSSSVLNSNATI